MQPAGKFGIEVNLLTGRYVATAHNDRRAAEWPPHVARLFSALVSAWAENGRDQAERAALEWLEDQDPPSIAASDAMPRRAVSHFVPVADATIIGLSRYENRAKSVLDAQSRLDAEPADTKAGNALRKKLLKAQDVQSLAARAGRTNPSAALRMFPEGRMRQERFFPSVTPREPRVTYVWSQAPPDGTHQALDRLLCRVTRLGHSSSLVSCVITRSPPSANYLPGRGGTRIRAVRRGQLAALERLHDAHQGVKPRSLPYEAVRYGAAAAGDPGRAPVRSNMAGEWIIFEFAHGSRAFPSTRTVDAARAMRYAIMRHTAGEVPEGVSGHAPNGEPTSLPHVAFLPIPYVGHERSDGRLLGMAMSIPELLNEDARRAALTAIGMWESESKPLELGLKPGVIRMARRRGLEELKSLMEYTWSGPSVRWVTATPISLPRHPGSLGKGTASARAKAWKAAESSVADACAHVGLPKPSAVTASLDPLIAGARPVWRFPPFIQGGRGSNVRRQLVHAEVAFDAPVAGPLALGTGRFMGLGLMHPVREYNGATASDDR